MAQLTRRSLIALGAGLGAVTAASRFFVTDSAIADGPRVDPKNHEAFGLIDRMAEQYMRDMSSPGMTLVLANRDAVLRTSTYGLSDLKQNRPVRPDQLFHIGSITKSIVAIALLQLRDEGKLDLHKPITHYLPWLKIEPREAITTHHLLTHSSGLPGGSPLFLPDPAAHHTAGFTPGSHHHYCNLGYRILGMLISKLDGRSWTTAVRARIFEPLGMRSSATVIAPAIKDRTVQSYVAWHDDRPHPRAGRLTEAPQYIYDGGSGSISSTGHDMGLYIRMLLSGGKTDHGRVVSESGFSEMVRHQIASDPDNPEIGYGYGLFVEPRDGHTIIRHTGGMVSFMSSMQIDLDEGVGAFASVNAQQGYRPNPVTAFALRALRAANEKKAMPVLPPLNPPTRVEDAATYAGVYKSTDRKQIEFVAEGNTLFLMYRGGKLPVENSSGGLSAPSGFLVQHEDFDNFPFIFERDAGNIVGLVHGSRWWTKGRAPGPQRFSHPDWWKGLVGHYRNDSPWEGSMKVVIRKGILWLDGVTPLRHVKDRRFRYADPEYNPEWVEFLDFVDGQSMHIKISGVDLWRVEAE